jgi:hypothetical protein
LRGRDRVPRVPSLHLGSSSQGPSRTTHHAHSIFGR